MREVLEVNRIGVVSSIDKKTGMVSVIYEDCGETTELLPYASFNDEYKPPEIGTKVMILQNSEGGIALGGFWNEENPAPDFTGTYRKKLGKNAYFEYDDETKTLTVVADYIKIKTVNGTTVK